MLSLPHVHLKPTNLALPELPPSVARIAEPEDLKANFVISGSL
jgi:hypothetical protein